MDKPNPDLGRFDFTKRESDKGAFKTPTLREIALTAPYMHDGSLATLEDVVEFYNKGGTQNLNLDQRIKKLNLTDQDKKDLVEFLKSLSGEGWRHAQPPKSFPQ
jgi:cytochrome c peroxidase